MTGVIAWPWVGVFGLGVWHGINPAMGWLFAVALGVQEESGRAVLRALGPLALGHALAVGAAVLAATLIGWVVPLVYLEWLVAVVLVAFGMNRLIRHRHPRWVGMRVGVKDLTLWAALMASAHGAGLMVLPFVLGITPPPSHAGLPHAPAVVAAPLHAAAGAPTDLASELAAHPVERDAAAAAGPMGGVWATLVHTAAYLLVTAIVAVIVYEKLGLRLLRSAWLNLDVIWGGALILTGVLTPVL